MTKPNYKKDYSDIINIEHWNPKNHPRMTVKHRAKQFKPFDFSGLVKSRKRIVSELEKNDGDYEKGFLFDD